MTYMAADQENPEFDNEITRVDPSGPKAVQHRQLLRAVLILHGHGEWSDDNIRAIWRQAVGSDTVTTRALLEAILRSGITV